MKQGVNKHHCIIKVQQGVEWLVMAELIFSFPPEQGFGGCNKDLLLFNPDFEKNIDLVKPWSSINVIESTTML